MELDGRLAVVFVANVTGGFGFLCGGFLKSKCCVAIADENVDNDDDDGRIAFVLKL